jgi:hypothetical protein
MTVSLVGRSTTRTVRHDFTFDGQALCLGSQPLELTEAGTSEELGLSAAMIPAHARSSEDLWRISLVISNRLVRTTPSALIGLTRVFSNLRKRRGRKVIHRVDALRSRHK